MHPYLLLSRLAALLWVQFFATEIYIPLRVSTEKRSNAQKFGFDKILSGE